MTALLFILIVKILRSLLSIEYEVYMADGYGAQDEDGNWNGLVGELVNR